MKGYRVGLRLCCVLLLVLVSSATVFGAGNMVLGLSSPALNEFYIRFEDFAQVGAKELGIQLITLNAEDKGEKQLRDVEDLIARGVDGIIVAPVTDAVARTIFQKCEEAGIPVIVADRNPGIRPQDEFKNYLAFVGPDNEHAGYLIAKYLIANMPLGSDGVKSLVALEGKLGSTNSELRTRGLMRALEEHPEVQLLAKQTAGFDRDQGMTVMEDFLVAYNNIDAVWSANDAMALGAIAAIRNANRMNEMIVGGMDTDRDACESVAYNQLN
ncbi:MAG: sugar ABC transporter substrate-binding protein, partial [Limnochordia bacterium]